MKYVNINFWQEAFKNLRKIVYPKKVQNPLELFIMDEKIGNKSQPMTIKQIMLPTEERNPTRQLKAWELRKLVNVLQWLKDDPHTHDLNWEEVLPEACKFRRINDKICVASIEQLEARQVQLTLQE